MKGLMPQAFQMFIFDPDLILIIIIIVIKVVIILK